jgi:hypothetical protein
MRGEPRVEYPRKERPFIRELFGDEADTMVHGLAARVGEVLGRPGFQFLMPAVGTGQEP